MPEQEDKRAILLVEDDPFLAEIYFTKLKEGGFAVTIAKDGVEVFEQLSRERPALMLLDLVLPKTDGFEVLERMRAEQILKDIPVVLLTNLGQKEDVERGLALGATAYLVKAQFTPSEIVEKVREILHANRH